MKDESELVGVSRRRWARCVYVIERRGGSRPGSRKTARLEAGELLAMIALGAMGILMLVLAAWLCLGE